MSDSVYLYQSMSLSPSSQAVPSSSSHSLLTFPSSSLPFLNISPSVSHISLYMQHFPKPFKHTSCNMPSHAVTIHICNIFIFIGLQTYLFHLECTIFSLCGVRSVYNFKYMCFGFSMLCLSVCGLIIVSCWLFLWFLICRLVQILFWCFGDIFFNFSIAILLLLTLH